MLTIRNEQLAVLGKGGAEHFRRQAVEYLRKVAPAVCAAMSEQHILESVDHAIAMCKLHGFAREVDVLRYLNLMYVFGFCFDRNPEFPWASRILNDRSKSPRARLDWLCSRALYEASRVGGRQ
jgi:hypothetical protein